MKFSNEGDSEKFVKEISLPMCDKQKQNHFSNNNI